MFRYEIAINFEAAALHYHLRYLCDEYKQQFGQIKMNYYIGETIDDLLYYRFLHSSYVNEVKNKKHDYVRLISENGIKVERHSLENRLLFIWKSNENTNMFEVTYKIDENMQRKVFQEEIQPQIEYFMLEVIDSIE